jgi:hypothetical protein
LGWALTGIHIFHVSAGAGNLRHQWDRYPDDGKGCAIELPFEALKQMADGGKSWACMKMHYDPSLQQEMAGRTVKRAVYLAREQDVSRSESERYWRTTQPSVSCFAESVLNIPTSGRMKNGAFSASRLTQMKLKIVP